MARAARSQPYILLRRRLENICIRPVYSRDRLCVRHRTGAFSQYTQKRSERYGARTEKTDSSPLQAKLKAHSPGRVPGEFWSAVYTEILELHGRAPAAACIQDI